jgi:hypothetical protein
LLETPVVPDQSLADQVKRALTFVFEAEVVVQVHAAFDDLATAITFHFECIVSFFGFGGRAPEEIFEEAHIILSMKLCWSSNPASSSWDYSTNDVILIFLLSSPTHPC